MIYTKWLAGILALIFLTVGYAEEEDDFDDIQTSRNEVINKEKTTSSPHLITKYFQKSIQLLENMQKRRLTLLLQGLSLCPYAASAAATPPMIPAMQAGFITPNAFL